MTAKLATGGADRQASDNERADVEAVIAMVRSEVESADLGAGVAAVERRLRQPLQRSAEYDSLRRNLTELQGGLSAFLSILEKAHCELDRREQMRADSERFSTVWWRQRQRSISEQPSPEKQSTEWVTVFAEALLAERFDVCARLASSGYPALPHDALLVRLARTGALAMAEDRWAAAVPLLRRLVDGPWGTTLRPAHRGSIELLLARILMPIAAERSGICRRLETAQARPGVTNAECALLTVALGECLLSAGDLDAAAGSFGQAAALDPQAHAPYVGLGLVAEQRKTWFTALDQFDQAVERAADGQALARLRAPVSGNLYWRLAIKLAGGQNSLEAPDPEVPAERRQAALEAIDTALRLGISGRTESPERRVLIYRADLLRSLGRSQDTGRAYFDISQRLQVPADDAEAHRYLQKACKLAPTVPVHHWSLAETLRRLAYDKDGNADRVRLDRSIRRWQAGAAISQPAQEEAWAYLTLALAKMDREMPTKRSTLWEVAALSERAVFLDGTYAFGWAVLALVHNRIGNPRTALAAANRALREDSSESIALESRTIALAHLEQNNKAAQAAQLLTDDSSSGLWPRLYVRLVARHPDEALSLLSEQSVENDPTLRFYRAMCNKALGCEADEVADLRWIWEHRDGGLLDPNVLGWTAYRLGYYDSAEDWYRRVLDPRDQSVLDPNAACDLGQVFLERGDAARHDLSNGAALLNAGIGQHALASLTLLGEIELPQLRRRLAGKPHADKAAAVIDGALALLRERHGALAAASVTPEAEMRWALDTGPARPVDLTMESFGAGPADQAGEEGAWRSARRQAAHAALGWLANAKKRWRDAAEAYVALGQEGLSEDAADGFTRAVAAMCAEADETARSGNLDAARVQYGDLAEQVAAHAPEEQELQSRLLCRVAVASVASGDTDGAHSNFEAAARLQAGRVQDWSAGEAGDELRAIARNFARSVPAFWAQTDGLTSVKSNPALTRDARALVDAMLAALSLDDAYRTRRSDVDSSTTFPLTNIVVLSLGRGLIPADTSERWPLFSTLLPQLRDHIEQEYGIRLPGVRVTDDSALAPTGFQILLFGVAVRRGEILGVGSPPGQPPPLDQAIAELRDVLIGNLGLLLGPDDLITWASSSAAAMPKDDLGQEALGDAETRLRVQRVLRLLSREGVPVTDRPAVLKAISAAVTGGADTLTALRAVRLRLAPALPGTRPGTRLEQLPAALESAVAQCLHTEDSAARRPAWQAPRAEAHQLARQLRDYFSSLPGGTAVVVRDPGVRFFVTRLLSGPRLQCHVLAEDELKAAGRSLASAVSTSAEGPAR